ncbi:MAG: response regulator transcription factor [Actinobacteria bacterium]|nr:response regulator transcription factor [Actinomycetota bacterium]
MVADGAATFRSAVASALRHEGFRVDEAANLHQLRGVVGARSSIVLVDSELPPLGGLFAATSLSERFGIHPILWSHNPESEDVLAAIRAGAAGYLSKEISERGLVQALRKFLDGEAPLSRQLTLKMIEGVHALEAWEQVANRLAALSRREREVLALIAAGLTNRQIAAQLVLALPTVKRHVQNVLAKLGVSSRQKAATLHTDLTRLEAQNEGGADVSRAAAKQFRRQARPLKVGGPSA